MKYKHKDLVSVVMLAKNERQSIEANNLCEKILEYTNDFIIMDGDSTDNTKEFCSKFTDKVFVDGGNGKGTAIIKNYKTKTQTT